MNELIHAGRNSVTKKLWYIIFSLPLFSFSTSCSILHSHFARTYPYPIVERISIDFDDWFQKPKFKTLFVNVLIEDRFSIRVFGLTNDAGSFQYGFSTTNERTTFTMGALSKILSRSIVYLQSFRTFVLSSIQKKFIYFHPSYHKNRILL